MWITTHEGQLVNLALYPSITCQPVGQNQSGLFIESNKPIFIGTPKECNIVMSALGVMLKAVNTVNLKTEESATRTITDREMKRKK